MAPRMNEWSEKTDSTFDWTTRMRTVAKKISPWRRAKKEGVEELLPLAAEESVGALAEHEVKTGYKHGEELAGEEEEGEQTEGPREGLREVHDVELPGKRIDHARVVGCGYCLGDVRKKVLVEISQVDDVSDGRQAEQDEGNEREQEVEGYRRHNQIGLIVSVFPERVGDHRHKACRTPASLPRGALLGPCPRHVFSLSEHRANGKMMQGPVLL